MPNNNANIAGAPAAATRSESGGKLEAAPKRRSRVESAIKLAQQGFQVFPIIENGKTPAVDGWQALASSDSDRVLALFRDRPHANLGALTERLLVVDIDPRNGGGATMKRVREEADLLGNEFPDTLASATAGGGVHLIYALPEGVAVKGDNKGKVIGPGVDIKSHGGLIVCAGSEIDGREYKWVPDHAPHERAIALAPQWLIDKCAAPRKATRMSGKRIVEEDETALEKAEAFLAARAPEAVQGGRDNTAYYVAASMYDYGISRETCLSLLIEWNETHCHPSLDLSDLERIAESAETSRDTAVGSKHPDAPGFDAVAVPCIATPLQRFDPAAIPAVPWVVRGLAARRAVTTLTGPGAASKSTWTLQLAIAAAAGRSDICGFEIKEPRRVWLWNQEDDLEEMQRRLAAIMQTFNVSWADLEDADGKTRLFLNSGIGKDKRLNLARRNGETTGAGLHLDAMVASTKHVNADLVILDPLISLHQSSENDNNQMRAVFDLIGGIAVGANCAVIVVSHTGKPDKASSKGFAGDAYAGRGVSAQPDAARAALTFMPMADGDKKNWRIPAADSHLDYARLDDAKMNLGKKRRDPRWFRHEEVLIAGFTGDAGHVLRPVDLEPTIKVGEADRLHALAKAIHDHLGANKPHTIPAVMEHLSPGDAAPLVEQRNRARRLDDMFGGVGVLDYLTEFGTLRRAAARGNRGTLLTLLATPQCLNTTIEAQTNG